MFLSPEQIKDLQPKENNEADSVTVVFDLSPHVTPAVCQASPAVVGNHFAITWEEQLSTKGEPIKKTFGPFVIVMLLHII